MIDLGIRPQLFFVLTSTFFFVLNLLGFVVDTEPVSIGDMRRGWIGTNVGRPRSCTEAIRRSL